MSYTKLSLTADKNNTLKQGRKSSNAINKDDLPIGYSQLTSLTAKLLKEYVYMSYTEISFTADKNNTLKQAQKLRRCALMIRSTAKAALGRCTHV
jgi:hypothetical protein